MTPFELLENKGLRQVSTDRNFIDFKARPRR